MGPHLTTISAKENGGRGGLVLSPQAITAMVAILNLFWGVIFAMFMVIRSADIKGIEAQMLHTQTSIHDLAEALRPRIERLERNQDQMVSDIRSDRLQQK